MYKTAALSQPPAAAAAAAAAAEALQISNSWPTYLLIIIASATNTLLLLLIVKLAVWGRQDRQAGCGVKTPFKRLNIVELTAGWSLVSRGEELLLLHLA